MKKILVIYPGKETYEDSPFHLLDPETGEHLASHFCSGCWFAKGDLHDGREDRLKEWKEKFNQESEAKFIDETEYNFEEVLTKNKNFNK